MLLREIVEKMSLEVVCGEPFLDKKVTGGYIGDLLSFVMSHAAEGQVWITIQGHINSVAVASLLGLSAIVLAEGATADVEMIEKAKEEEIPILATNLSSFAFALAWQKTTDGNL